MAENQNPRNILLLYPNTPKDTYWSFSHALGMIGRKANTPPLGLLTVAAMLPRDGFSLRLVDMNIQPLEDADVQWADLVFVSTMIAQKDSLAQILTRLKAAGRTVVAGGPYTSSAYRETANVDTFVIGEAEAVWDIFLADLTAGTLRPAYAAPVREEEAAALREHFGPRAVIAPAVQPPDINLAPLPRFDLLRLSDYALMPVQASRGCPVGCEFCDIWRRFGRKPRNKRHERLLAELDELYRLGWRDTVFLVDDNFIGNKTRAKELLGEIILWQEAHGRPFPFLTEATLSMADDEELLDLMQGAGFNSVFVGIETPAQESLHETRKYINTKGSMSEKVARIQARGIQIMSGFIIGFDADPEDIASRMTDCIQEMGIPQAMIGLLTALPETDLYERLEKENRIRGATSGNNTHGFSLNFQPARPEAKVVDDYKRVLDAAYSRNMKSYFERAAVLRSRWPAKQKHKFGAMTPGYRLRALFSYLWAVARSSYRWNAAKFLATTLFTKPSFMVEAVTLGVKGHHLWAITRNAFEVENMRMFMLERLRGYAALVQEKAALVQEKAAQMQHEKAALVQSRAEELLKEAGRIKREAQREFSRLSHGARASARGEFDWFLAEMDRLYRGLTPDAATAKV